MQRTCIVYDRHLFINSTHYDEDLDEKGCDPCLEDCKNWCFSECRRSTWNRLLYCPLQVQERLLGSLAGYMRHPNASRWIADDFLKMLLANETRTIPRVWIQKEMVGTLGPSLLSQVPRVAQWVRTFNAHSQPMRLFIIRRLSHLQITFEQWILKNPTERQERVLAYRTRGDAVCSCCRGPATWQLPGGQRGCGLYVISLVAKHVSQKHWHQMTATLSRSEQGLLAHCLLHDVIGARIFVASALEPNCLTCSCGECGHWPAWNGDECAGETHWLSCDWLFVESPRQPSDTLWDWRTEDEWVHLFDNGVSHARYLQREERRRRAAEVRHRG